MIGASIGGRPRDPSTEPTEFAAVGALTVPKRRHSGGAWYQAWATRYPYMILAASPSTAPAWTMIAIFVIVGAAALIVEYLYYRHNPGGAAAERPGSYYAWRERFASRHPLKYAAWTVALFF